MLHPETYENNNNNRMSWSCKEFVMIIIIVVVVVVVYSFAIVTLTHACLLASSLIPAQPISSNVP